MTHDPLCPINAAREHHWRLCLCGIIAEVRQEEREATLDAIRPTVTSMQPLAIALADFIRGVQREAIGVCIAAVEDLLGPEDEELRWLLDGEAVLSALRELQEKP